MQLAVQVLTIPVTLFEANPDGSVVTDVKKLKPKNPRPLNNEQDLQKLNYRIEVSKDLMKGIIKQAHELGSERAIKDQLEQGVTAT